MKHSYKTKIQVLSTIVISALCINANSQIITFEKNYPATFDQSAKDVYSTTDGGYLIAGTEENSDPNDLDIILVKTNSIGDIQTIKTYGGSRVDYPNDILPTSDGNFFIVGYTRSYGTGDQDIYLMKVDQDGDTLFTKRFGGIGNDEGKEIVATADGNYVIVGGSSVGSNNEMELIKIDINGNALWAKFYGTSQYESARSVKLCPDGGFIIAGKTSLNPISNATVMLVRTNSSGDTTWTKTINGGTNSFEGKSIVANSDGTFTLAIDDSSAASDSDVRIMKLDATGGIIWNKMYGGLLKDIIKTLRPTSDGGYILGAISRSFGWVKPDMWLLKLDSNGDSLWTRNYGGPGNEHCYSARQTSDGGYAVIGHARSFGPTWEMYFVKLDGVGVVGINELADGSKLQIFPNPSNGLINIDLKENLNFTAFRITNSIGQTVYSENFDSLQNNDLLSIDLKNRQRGIYFITFLSPTHNVTTKLILN